MLYSDLLSALRKMAPEIAPSYPEIGAKLG